MNAHPSRRQMTRTGYTLMELTLVCALIAMVAGITAPTINSMYSRQRVDSGVDAVRAAWARAKAAAIKEGRPYRFSVVMGKGNYRIAPDQDSSWTNTGGNDTARDSHDPGAVRQGALPPGVVFLGSGDTAPTSTDTVLPPDKVSPEQYQAVVVFQPDGTAREDVEITFSFKGTRPQVVRLRAMTGVVTVKPQGAH